MCNLRAAEMSVREVASLAKLALSEAETLRLQSDMEDILAFAAALQAVDTADVPPTLHASPLQNILREDTPAPSMPREMLLRNAPATAEGCVAVPKTFD